MITVRPYYTITIGSVRPYYTITIGSVYHWNNTCRIAKKSLSQKQYNTTISWGICTWKIYGSRHKIILEILGQINATQKCNGGFGTNVLEAVEYTIHKE